MIQTMTNEELRSFIPNVVHEVKGETLLIDKIRPWLSSSQDWLINGFVGSSFEFPESLLPLAKKLIVWRAMTMAIPSLDLSLTPAGFSVINTDGRAPASKERVERLIASLKSSVDANLPPFISSLLKLPEWRDTAMGGYWADTFMLGLDDAEMAKGDRDLVETYRQMREHALRFQRVLAQEYVGAQVLLLTRGAVYDEAAPSDNKLLWQTIRSSELKYVKSRMAGEFHPDEIWHLAEPILLVLRNCADLGRIWEEEMGEYLNVEPFKNTRKGGYFF